MISSTLFLIILIYFIINIIILVLMKCDDAGSVIRWDYVWIILFGLPVWIYLLTVFYIFNKK